MGAPSGLPGGRFTGIGQVAGYNHETGSDLLLGKSAGCGELGIGLVGRFAERR